MASEYDGTVKLGVEFDTKDVKQSAKDLKQTVEKELSSVDVKNLEKSFDDIQESVEEATKETKQLTQAVSELNDTEVKIDGLSDNSIRDAADDLRNSLQQAVNAFDGKQLDSKTASFRNQLQSTVKQVDNIQSKLDSLHDVKFPTEGFKELQERSSDLKATISSLETSMESLRQKGMQDTDTYKQFALELASAKGSIEGVTQAMKEMEEKGTAYYLGQTTEEYKNLVDKLDDMNSRMRILKQRTNEQNVAWLKSTKGFQAASIIFKTLGNDIKKVIGHLKQCVVHLGNMAKGAIINGIKRLGEHIGSLGKHASSSEFSFSKLFRTLMAYGLGINTITSLFSKLRNAVISGLEAFQQYQGGLNPVTVSMNQFQQSLQYLQNSLGAAFAPIVTTVLPILSGFINRLAEAIQTIGAFFSALKGMSTYTKALNIPFKSKETQKAEKADIKAQNQANKKSAQQELKQREAEYKKQVAEQKAAISERNKERRNIERSNKQISKNNTTTNRNTNAKNKNTKAIKANNAALKKQKDTLAGFDDLDVLNKEEENENALSNTSPAATQLAPAMASIPPELSKAVTDFNDALGEIPQAVQEAVDAFEEAEIPSWITDLVNTIKGFISNNDWYGLGQFIAGKLNGILTSIDDWINNVFRPQGVKWAQNLAQFLNGLVDGINWLQLGKTIADGMNAVMAILYTFLTTFDFLKFGKKLGAGILSWFQNIDWALAGSTFAAGWNALFHIIEGIVTTPGIWAEIGTSLGTFLKNAIADIDIDSLVTSFIAIFNGIFEMLGAFLATKPFEGLAEKIYNGLNRIIHEINWAEAGATLSKFVMELLSVFLEVAKNTDWEGFGKAIGEFLGNVQWVQIFTTVGEILWLAISGMLKGLLSTDGGKVFLAVIAGIEGLKIAFSLGANLLLPAIEKVLIEKLAQLLVTGGFKSIFTACVSAVSGAFTSILATIASAGPMIITAISTLLTTITTVISTALTFLFSPTGIIIMIVAGALILIGKYIYDNWDTISAFLSKCWQWFIDFFNQLPEFVQNVLKAVANIFINIINFTIFKIELFVNIVITAVNNVLNAINLMLTPINAVMGALSGGTIHFEIPNIPGVTLPKIPNLAQGAVIPPNKEFLAMLGDQKSGTNIEAPLDTIVDAFRQVVGNMQVQNTGYSEMTLDGQVFARLATPYVISELSRRGYDVSVLEG